MSRDGGRFVMTVAKAEFKRLRLPLFFLILVGLLTLYLLSGGQVDQVAFHYQSTEDVPAWLQAWNMETLFTMAMNSLKMLPALMIGVMMTLIFPWRSKQEWQSGLALHQVMSPLPSWRWEAQRFLLMLTILASFYGALFLAGGWLVADAGEHYSVSQVLFWQYFPLLALVGLPLLLSLGFLSDALRAAYLVRQRQKSIGCLLTLLWWIAPVQLAKSLLVMMRSQDGLWLEPWVFAIQGTVGLVSGRSFIFFPELIPLSLALAALGVYLAARIVEEMEIPC
jgi:hypothetical protein